MRSGALLLSMALATAGCGTTTIVSNDRQARIWVDGQMVGRGTGTITKRGPFGDAQVLVKTPDGRRVVHTISRSFTAATLVLGLVTYGVCLLACWEYPDSLVVQFDQPNGGPASVAPRSSWEWTGEGASGPGVDPWLQPPPGWRPSTPTPGEQPAAPAAPVPPLPASPVAPAAAPSGAAPQPPRS